MPLIRLDKLISDSGRASRSEAKALIRAGRVSVDGRIAARAEDKYERSAVVRIDGEAIDAARFHYVMLHKPAGVLSATEDARQKTVLDLLPPALRRLELFPVGRLDKDTTGLLLLTDDGDFAHRVISPKKHVPKRYRARLDAPLEEGDVEAFATGLTLEDGTACLPAALRVTAPAEGLVTVYEGKYHQVKRMFAARGKHVLALHREGVGALALDPSLPPGGFRSLSPEEAAKALEPGSCENDGRIF